MLRVWSVFILLLSMSPFLFGGPPRLVVVISVDQLRPDYLDRFQSGFLPARQKNGEPGGFRLLLEEGAVYRNAAYGHFPTFTCPGHAAILSGALPSVSGIIGNRWFDRESGKIVGCVDPLGRTNETERTPRSLLVSTVGDELKLSNNGASKVIGVGGKDYAVMALVGRMADLALWFDRRSGRWTTSSHYTRGRELPQWLKDLNASGPADRFRGRTWTRLLPPHAYRGTNPNPIYEGVEEDAYGYGWRFPHALGGDTVRVSNFFNRLMASPFGNDLLLDAGRRAVEGESLGLDDDPDILALTFSSNDHVGHTFGPSSPEAADSVYRTDRQLSEFLHFLIGRVGQDRLLVVLTSDHGVQYIPREIQGRGGAAGRVARDDIKKAVETELDSIFGQATWVWEVVDLDLYLNRKIIAERGLDPAQVEQAAAEALMRLAGIQQAFSRGQILSGRLPPTDLGQRVANSFHPKRSGDVVIVYEPNWFLDEDLVTTHGPPHPSNTQVPMLFWGGGVPAGVHWRPVDPRDIAATLSQMLGIGYPSGNSGQPLREVLAKE